MSKYLFYPGCSMQRSARPYLDSTMAIREDMGMELEDVQDWNCCGATEYTSVHKTAAYALVGRNLALAAKQVDGADTLVAGCSACYLNLSKTDRYMRDDEKLNSVVNEALAAGGLQYDPGSVQVRHLLDVIFNDVGLEAVKSKVTKPLKGLRVAPYYGCMIVRPDPDNRFGNTEYPQALDKLMKALGAEVIDFPLKTHCCGGHMTQISQSTAYELIRRLLYGADQYRADVLVTLCPMCQLNLDAYQGETNKHFGTSFHIPVLYFTQLMGLAFGHPAAELGLGKEFVDSRPALSKIGVEVPEEESKPPRRRRRRDDPTLPMPRMDQDGEEEA
ncbi:MAG: CoB--CoM heterodisulfide reductase iron-sulfur subunit B family protein [Candidatus Promineifilaceae bacterium]|nr:CoB--CoM heterodisulfide reductase iron-sulfur subunit B family protein [Candidatus Promineifilaceae bacterium]